MFLLINLGQAVHSRKRGKMNFDIGAERFKIRRYGLFIPPSASTSDGVIRDLESCPDNVSP